MVPLALLRGRLASNMRPACLLYTIFGPYGALSLNSNGTTLLLG